MEICLSRRLDRTYLCVVSIPIENTTPLLLYIYIYLLVQYFQTCNVFSSQSLSFPHRTTRFHDYIEHGHKYYNNNIVLETYFSFAVRIGSRVTADKRNSSGGIGPLSQHTFGPNVRRQPAIPKRFRANVKSYGRKYSNFSRGPINYYYIFKSLYAAGIMYFQRAVNTYLPKLQLHTLPRLMFTTCVMRKHRSDIVIIIIFIDFYYCYYFIGPFGFFNKNTFFFF